MAWTQDFFHDLCSATPPGLYRNNGNCSFTLNDVGSPTSVVGGWHVLGDYNNDGFLDIFVAFGPNKRNLLFRHNGNANHWLKVKLDGRASNRSGIGAKVRVNATIGGTNFWQMREISGQGLGLDNGLLAHFGLGDATNVTTLRIEWPSGIVQVVTNVTANQFLTVVESGLRGRSAPV
ncbi:MAG: CRTAC1 family protein [Verrucomicrobiota bacterium]